MVLQILFLGPSNLLEPNASFAQMSQKLIVSPIVKTLVFSKVPEKVCSCDRWKIQHQSVLFFTHLSIHALLESSPVTISQALVVQRGSIRDHNHFEEKKGPQMHYDFTTFKWAYVLSFGVKSPFCYYTPPTQTVQFFF